MKLSSLFITSLLLTLSACGPGLQSQPDSVSESEISGNILGGQRVIEAAIIAKTTVMINLKTKKVPVESFFCSATLISQNFAITAAHCVKDAEAVSLEAVSGVQTPVLRVISHPDYNPNVRYDRFDLALVEFVSHPRLSLFAELADDVPAIGDAVQIAGFGRTKANEPSARKLNYVEVKMQSPAFTLSEALLDEGARRGACHGDSGGPAFSLKGGRILLWGVDSRSPGRMSCGVIELYTKVKPALDWIKTYIQ